MKKQTLKLFRIYTEDINYESVILPILNGGFDGFSVYRGIGYWKSTKEKSLLIEVYTANRALIRALAQRIKTQNNQQAVLVTETKSLVEFI